MTIQEYGNPVPFSREAMEAFDYISKEVETRFLSACVGIVLDNLRIDYEVEKLYELTHGKPFHQPPTNIIWKPCD